MHLFIRSVHLNERIFQVLLLRPIVMDYLPFLRNINVSLSAVWEGVDSVKVEVMR